MQNLCSSFSFFLSLFWSPGCWVGLNGPNFWQLKRKLNEISEFILTLSNYKENIGKKEGDLDIVMWLDIP